MEAKNNPRFPVNFIQTGSHFDRHIQTSCRNTDIPSQNRQKPKTSPAKVIFQKNLPFLDSSRSSKEHFINYKVFRTIEKIQSA